MEGKELTVYKENNPAITWNKKRMGRILISYLYNPFDKRQRKDVYLDCELAKPISAYLKETESIIRRGISFVYSLSGRVIKDSELDHICPSPGDQLVVMAVPAGGGDDGILKTVLMVAVIVVASIVAPGVGTAIGSAIGSLTGGLLTTTGALLFTALAQVAITTVGGLLVNALLPPPSPSLPSYSAGSLGIGAGIPAVSDSVSNMGQTTTYGWGPMENLQVQGFPIPRLYGKRQVAGNIISRSIDLVGDDQYLNILSCAGEGPVDINNININGQPQANYSDINVDTTRGTLNQSALTYFGDTFSTQTYNTEIGTDWTQKQTVGSSSQGLRIAVIFPTGLYYIGNDGNLTSTSVTLSIDYKKSSEGSWTSYDNQTVTGATQSAKRAAWDIRGLSSDQYDVRIKVANRSTGTRYATTVYLASISEIILDDFAYPMSSLLGLRIKATQQISNNQPTVTYDAERRYVPVWDGSKWTVKRSRNPAWAAYDALVRPYYVCDLNGGNLTVHGIDGVGTNRMVYADFLAWANYCDTKGIYINIVFDSHINIWDAISEISQVGRGAVIMRGTKFSCVIDKADSPVQMFTIANIQEDSLKIDYLPTEDRANIVETTYFDSNRNYQRETFFVFGNDYDSANEERKSILTLNGCVSYDQAWKEADYRLKCNQYLIRTVSFGVDIDALACQVGDIIRVQHDVPQWGFGGRVLDGTSNTVTLDQEVTIAAGSTYSVIIRHSDDTFETKTVTTGASTTDLLTISGSFDSTPTDDDMYSFGVQGSETKNFRVVKLSRTQDLKKVLTGVEYNASIYTDGTPITLSESALYAYPVSSRLSALERLRIGPGGSWVSEVHISWERVSNSAEGSWKIYRKDLSVSNADWEHIGDSFDTFFISSADWIMEHVYEISVCGVSALTGRTDVPDNTTNVEITILWKYNPPDDVGGFAATFSDGRIVFNWDHVTDVDRRGYEIREGPTWAGGFVIASEISENRYVYYPTYDGTYIYMIKAIDTSGNYSTNPSQITITITGMTDILNVIYSKNEIQDFIDEIASVSNVTSNLVYVPSGASRGLHVPHALLDNIAGVSTWTDTGSSVEYYDGSTTTSGYYTSPVRSTGKSALSTIRLLKNWDSELIHATDQTIAGRTDQTYPNDDDQHITSNTTIQTLYRISETSPITSVSWSTYGMPVRANFRYFQRKEIFELDTKATSLSYTTLQTHIDVPDKTYTFRSQTIGSSGTTFTLSDLGVTIFVGYAVAVQPVTNAYFAAIKNKDVTAFYAILYDSGANKQAGLVDMILKGF